jgi:hypothetical protein
MHQLKQKGSVCICKHFIDLINFSFIVRYLRAEKKWYLYRYWYSRVAQSRSQFSLETFSLIFIISIKYPLHFNIHFNDSSHLFYKKNSENLNTMK